MQDMLNSLFKRLKVSWGPAWVTKNEHFLKKISWGPMWAAKTGHCLKKVSWGPMSVTKISTFSRRSVGAWQSDLDLDLDQGLVLLKI